MSAFGLGEVVAEHHLATYEETKARVATCHPDAVKKWEDTGVLRYAMAHPEHAEWIATNLVPSDGNLEPLPLIRKRCALLDVLAAVDRFKGMFFRTTMVAGAYLRRIGVGGINDVPSDLHDRVALAAEKIRGFDNEDMFYLLTNGAHWLVTQVRTREEIEVLVKAADSQVSWVPHVRKRRRGDDSAGPARKSAKLLAK